MKSLGRASRSCSSTVRCWLRRTHHSAPSRALTAHSRLVRYHRRGYAGSSRVAAPFSIAQQAADCLALLRHLGIERAHVVGHSSGGIVALRLALDVPEVVHSLVLLEPALLDVPSGPQMGEVLGPVLQRYGAGDKEGAVDSFLRWAIGPDYRTWLDPTIPGAYDQMVADADTFFGVELPSLQEWYLTREDARADYATHTRRLRVGECLDLAWLG